jgi:hypothetical protein
MNSFRFTVSLRFFSKNVDPQEICDQLRMKPKWMHKIGDQRTSAKGLPIAGHYDLSYCTFPLVRQGAEELSEMSEQYFAETLSSAASGVTVRSSRASLSH